VSVSVSSVSVSVFVSVSVSVSVCVCVCICVCVCVWRPRSAAPMCVRACVCCVCTWVHANIQGLHPKPCALDPIHYRERDINHIHTYSYIVYLYVCISQIEETCKKFRVYANKAVLGT
jgi:hypothetical protein